MATAESVKAKLLNLIAKANGATGNTDADLTSAMDTLIAGFGQGGGEDTLAQLLSDTLTEYEYHGEGLAMNGKFNGLSNLKSIRLYPVLTSTISASTALSGNNGTEELLIHPQVADSAVFLQCGVDFANGASALKKVDVDKCNRFAQRAFANCTNLTTLIIRTDTVATLYNTTAFTSTPIANGTGFVYVPAALMNSYKAASNWSTFADQIRAIEDYPEITGG